MRRLLALTIVLASCGGDEPLPVATGPSQPAVCPGSVAAAAWRGPEQVAVTGPSVNAVHQIDRQVYLVVSEDNTVLRYIPESDTLSVFADLGNERGPYDMAWDDAHIYVTNYLSNSVSILTRSGDVVTELDGFDGPSGIAKVGGYLYVSNVEYLGPGLGYGAGSVTVIDPETLQVLGRLPTARQNPQFLAAHGNALYVSETGELGFVDGEAVALNDGALERWTPTDSPLAPKIDVAILELSSPGRAASPGRPEFLGDSVYVASATAPEVYALDARTFEWRRGIENPITLYTSTTDALHHMASDGQILYVSAFNQDQIWRIDPSCDAVLGDPLEAGFSDLLEGVHAMTAIHEDDGTTLYFALNLANALASFRFYDRETR